MKKRVKKLEIAKETILMLNGEKLLEPQGGTHWPSWICGTSAGAHFCDHECA